MNELIQNVTQELTVKFGIAGSLIITLCWLVRYLVKKILEDKDTQIKALQEENKDYRDKFVNLIDKQFNFAQEKEQQTKRN